MEIGAPKITEEGDKVFCRFPISGWDKETLWFSIEAEYKDLLTDRCDAALVALLIPAMGRQEDIEVHGTISERLYYTLSKQYQAILSTVIPSLEPIEIRASEILPAQDGGTGVATGFSAGVDSFSVLADHYYSETPDGFEITHLLFNNVGSHGSGAERHFRERYEMIRPAAEKIGLPFVMVNSNVDAFYDDFGFQLTHTPRNCAVPLLLQSGIGRFYYGSAFSYQDISVEKTYDMAYSDPAALPLLSPEGLDMLSVGSEYTRVEKTIQIAEIDDSHDSLNVCVRPGSAGNCSDCWKCRRTLLTLEIAGLLDRYTEVFDLDVYRQRREDYMGRVLASDDSLLREIVAFADERGFEFPPRAKRRAYTIEKLRLGIERVNKKAIENETLKNFVKSNPRLQAAARKWLQIVKP